MSAHNTYYTPVMTTLTFDAGPVVEAARSAAKRLGLSWYGDEARTCVVVSSVHDAMALGAVLGPLLVPPPAVAPDAPRAMRVRA